MSVSELESAIASGEDAMIRFATENVLYTVFETHVVEFQVADRIRFEPMSVSPKRLEDGLQYNVVSRTSGYTINVASSYFSRAQLDRATGSNVIGSEETSRIMVVFKCSAHVGDDRIVPEDPVVTVRPVTVFS